MKDIITSNGTIEYSDAFNYNNGKIISICLSYKGKCNLLEIKNKIRELFKKDSLNLLDITRYIKQIFNDYEEDFLMLQLFDNRSFCYVVYSDGMLLKYRNEIKFSNEEIVIFYNDGNLQLSGNYKPTKNTSDIVSRETSTIFKFQKLNRTKDKVKKLY